MSTNRVGADDLALLQRAIDLVYQAEIKEGLAVPQAYWTSDGFPGVTLCMDSGVRLIVVDREGYGIYLTFPSLNHREMSPAQARTLAKHLAKAALMVEINEAGKDE